MERRFKRKKELLFLVVSSNPVSNLLFWVYRDFLQTVVDKDHDGRNPPGCYSKKWFWISGKIVFNCNFWSVWNQESDVENRIDDC